MTALALAPEPTAREYLRVSSDKSGTGSSPARQHRDNSEAAADAGWQLGMPYTEAAAISASRYSSKDRAGFQDLIEDLETGRFGADILIMWEASRGSRRVSEWAALIDALEDARVRVYVTNEARLYDTANWRDRKSLRASADDAETESDKISQRVGSAMRTEAETGNPHGRRVYGYERTAPRMLPVNAEDYRDMTPAERQQVREALLQPGEYMLVSHPVRAVRQVPHPAEAPAVQLIFASLLQGESLRSIAAALAGNGPTPAMGQALADAAAGYQGQGAPGVWTAPRVRDVALNPVYAAKRLHITAEARKAATPGGKRSGHQPEFQLSQLQDGNWPALVSFSDFAAVVAKLRANTRTSKTLTRQPQHLLSMIATCGVCGSKLSVRTRHGRPTYVCHGSGGHVSISEAELDALVTAATQDRLAHPDLYGRRPEATAQGELLQAARDQLAAAKTRQGEIAAAMVDPDAPLAALTEAARLIAQRIREAEARVQQLAAPAGLQAVGLAAGADIFSRWQSAPLNARRAAVRDLFSRIAVQATGRHFDGPAIDRLVIEYRQDVTA